MDGPRYYHANYSLSDSETPMSYAITYMWNLKKGHKELLCRTDTDPHILKKLRFPKEKCWGLRGCAAGWDGNAIKLGHDYHCTTINVIHLID